jgi:hypothetical protein
MPCMVSYPRRPLSGHITCYLNPTYHVLPTPAEFSLDTCTAQRHAVAPIFAYVMYGRVPGRIWDRQEEAWDPAIICSVSNSVP